MSRLDSHHLLAGLSKAGVLSSTTVLTPAYQEFAATNADLADITPLKHYPYLQVINLSHNALESVHVLSACASLRQLDVSHNLLTSLLDFSPPRALTHVNYSHNNLSSLGDFLLRNKYLKELDLSVNRLRTLDGIGSLEHLTQLIVARNEIETISAVTCPTLMHLDVANNFLKDCRSLAGETLQHSLRTLNLNGNQIESLEGLEALTLLSTLSLAANPISDLSEITRLTQLEHLSSLDLSETPLSTQENYRIRLLHLLPRLEVLDGIEVTAHEIVEAHNAHGEDHAMREAISLIYLPKNELTRREDTPKFIAPLGEATPKIYTSAGASVGGNAEPQTTLLPKDQFWNLLSERGFTAEWMEWLRVAKNRLIVFTEVNSTEEQRLAGQSVDLSGISLGEAGSWALAELVDVRPFVSVIDLSGALNPLRWSAKLSDSYGIRRLFDSFSQLYQLRTLRLSNCFLGREGGLLLAGYLASPRSRASLKSLHLSHNLLGENLVMVTENTGERLVVHACPGLKAILAALSSGGGQLVDGEVSGESQLEYLDLSHCNIDAQGARAVAQFLEGRTNVSAAAVAEPQYNEAGEEILVESSAIPVIPQLRVLILDNNPLSDDGLTLIGRALRSNNRLESLSIRGDSENSLGARGIADFSLSVSRYNRALKHLELAGNKSLFAAGTSPELEAGAAEGVSGLLFHASNGQENEAGALEYLGLADTGVTDPAIKSISVALGKNSSLKELNLSYNPDIGESGRDAFFTHLHIQSTTFADQTPLQSLKLQGWKLGLKSTLRLAEWIAASQSIQQLLFTAPVIQGNSVSSINSSSFGSVFTDTSVWGLAKEDANNSVKDEQERLVNLEQPFAGDLSELVVSTLSIALKNAVTKNRLSGLALPKEVDSFSAILLEHFTEAVLLTVQQAEENPEATAADAEGDEDGAETEAVPATVSVSSGLFTSLDLSSFTWSIGSFQQLVGLVSSQNHLTSLVLRNSSFDEDLSSKLDSAFADLFTALLSVGSVSSIDLSGSAGLGARGLEGIGRGILAKSEAGVYLASLQHLNVASCGVEYFGLKEGGDSEFLRSIAAESNGLFGINLSGNDLDSSELLRLVEVLNDNWSLRLLDLSDITIKNSAESVQVISSLLSHSVSHGLQSLLLPSMKQSATTAQAARDAVIGAVARGWKDGVNQASRFLTEQNRSAESVLHTLTIDLSVAFEQISWKQKQQLLEAVRPLSQKSTQNVRAQESFRLAALLAGGKPIRVNTQQLTCGVDLIENALAARLACQRL